MPKLNQIIPDDIRLHILQNNIASYNDTITKATLVQQCTIQNNVLSTTLVLDTRNAIDSISTQIHALQSSVDNLNNKQLSDNDSNNSLSNFKSKSKLHQF